MPKNDVPLAAAHKDGFISYAIGWLPTAGARRIRLIHMPQNGFPRAAARRTQSISDVIDLRPTRGFS